MSLLNNAEYTPFPHIKLNKFNKTINLTMSRIFKVHGYNITREQEAILRSLCVSDGINQAELASMAGQERNNLSRTLSILEEKGLILRKVCAADKRNSLVYITPVGRALHAKVHRAVEEYRHILFRDVSQESVNEFARLVEKLTDNLESYLEGRTPLPDLDALELGQRFPSEK